MRYCRIREKYYSWLMSYTGSYVYNDEGSANLEECMIHFYLLLLYSIQSSRCSRPSVPFHHDCLSQSSGFFQIAPAESQSRSSLLLGHICLYLIHL
jgi:hypothetical protein